MNPECQNCPMRELINQLREQLANVDQKYAEQISKMEQKYSDSRQKIYGRLETLETERGRTEEQYKSIISDITELKQQQKEIVSLLNDLKQQPAKRWDSMVSSGISTIVGALIGYIGTKMGG